MNDLIKLADRFLKISQDTEADSSIVTPTVRTITNPILDKECPVILDKIYKMENAGGARIGGRCTVNAQKGHRAGKCSLN